MTHPLAPAGAAGYDGRMWTWSELDEEQVRLLSEVEESLDGELVLAYRPAQPGKDRPVTVRMTPAQLDQEALRRIEELERTLGVVAVAYSPD